MRLDLTKMKIQWLLFFIVIYSGVSATRLADTNTRRRSGSDSNGCTKTDDAAQKATILSGTCFLNNIFMQYNEKPLPTVLQTFLSGSALNCQKLELTSENVKVTCSRDQGLRFLESYLQTSGETTVIVNCKIGAETYADVEVTVQGPFRGQVLKAHKPLKKQDFVLTLIGLLPTLSVQDFLNQHFQVNVQDLQVTGTSGTQLAAIPSGFSNAILKGSFVPEEYFELLVSESPTQKEYLVIQKFPDSIKPVVAFFRENPTSLSKESSILERVYNLNIKTGFAPFLEVAATAFSSTTHPVGIVMEQEVLDLMEHYKTESAKSFFYAGKNVYWLINDPKHLKKRAVNVPGSVDIHDVDLGEEEGTTTTNPSSKEKHKKVAKTKEAARAKREEDTTPVYKNEISLVAAFPIAGAENQNVTIHSPDYVEGSLKDVLDTFVPNPQMWTSPQDIKIAETKVVFDSIQIDHRTKKMSIVCIINENIWLGGNVVNMKGMHISGITTLPADDQTGAWVLSGNGTVQIFKKLVDIEVKLDADGYYHVTGSFAINNMTQLIKDVGCTKFVSDAIATKFPTTQSFPLDELNLDTKLGDSVFRIVGNTPLFSKADHSEEQVHTSIEILIKSSDESLDWHIGLVGHQTTFDAMMQQLFRIETTGVPWLEFEEVGIILSKTDMQENRFEIPILKTIPIAAGMHWTGKIHPARHCTHVTTEDGEVDGIDNMCIFFKENSHLIDNLQNAEGTVDLDTFTFGAATLDTNFVTLVAGNPLKISNPSLKLNITSKRELEGQSKINTNKVHDEEKKIEVALTVSGQFKSDGTDKVTFAGEIGLNDLGEIQLTVTSDFKWTSNLNEPFYVQNKDGKSVIKDGAFNSFVLSSPAKIGLDKSNIIQYKMKSRINFNLAHEKEMYWAARRRSRTEDFLKILSVFGKSGEHILITAAKSFGPSTAFFSRREEGVYIGEFDRTIHKGLSFEGSFKTKAKRYNYEIRVVNQVLTVNLTLPPIINQAKTAMLQKGQNITDEGGNAFLTYNEQGKATARISGYLKTIGLEQLVTFDMAENGEFKLDLNQNGNVFKLYEEAPAIVSLMGEGITKLRNVNPVLLADLKPGKVEIEAAVDRRILKVAEDLEEAVGTSNVNRLEGELNEDVTDHVETIKDAMESLNEEISDDVDKIQDAYNSLDKDCVDKCNREGALSVPGFTWNPATQQMQFDQSKYSTSNVHCIAKCEAVKVDASAAVIETVNQAKKNIERFEELQQKITEVEKIYIQYTNALAQQLQSSTEIKTLITPFADLIGGVSGKKSFFKLKSLELKQTVNSITVNKEKCVDGFVAKYRIFSGPKETFTYQQCFNGEYEEYFGKIFVNEYLGEANVALYRRVMQKYQEAKADFESQKEDILKSLKELKERHAEDAVEIMENSKRRFSIESSPHKAVFNGKFVIGKRAIHIPVLHRKIRKLLKQTPTGVSRSLKTRRVFMYSSPWAAINVFDPSESLSNAKVEVRNYNKNDSICGEMRTIADKYSDVYETMYSVADSYKSSNSAINEILSHQRSKISSLKSSIGKVVVSTNKTAAKRADMMYWIDEANKGMDKFSMLSQEKMSKHNATAFTTLKRKIEVSLKRQSLPDLAGYLHDLNTKLAHAYKRATIPSSGKTIETATVNRLSTGLVSLFNTPSVSIDEASRHIFALQPDIQHINTVVDQCS